MDVSADKTVKKTAKHGAGNGGHNGTGSGAGAERRRKLTEWMRTQTGPVHGDDLARRFRVSRQCLVQDVAVLRAAGVEILSTPQGYRLPEQGKPPAHRATLACRHTPEQTEQELNILVDHGVRVLDVVVEHALYGELRGSLMIESRADVKEFLRRWNQAKASLLSSLTRGVHLHTVESSRPKNIAQAKARLLEAGILLR
jgi:transcriptional regulator of NAD metabolism